MSLLPGLLGALRPYLAGAEGPWPFCLGRPPGAQGPQLVTWSPGHFQHSSTSCPEVFPINALGLYCPVPSPMLGSVSPSPHFLEKGENRFAFGCPRCQHLLPLGTLFPAHLRSAARPQSCSQDRPRSPFQKCSSHRGNMAPCRDPQCVHRRCQRCLHHTCSQPPGTMRCQSLGSPEVNH